jgi:predicted O-methyltransferase YrrM
MRAEGPPGSRSPEAAGYADRYAVESPALLTTRARAERLSTPPMEPSAGAALAVLAATGPARHVVSIGGGGIAGLWLLQGMRPDGVLTALDGDPEQLRSARAAFAEAGVPPGRTRLIFGTPAEVLPRLSSGAYDLVSCAGDPREYKAHLPTLFDLVHPGGVVAFHGLLAGGRIADRSARDPQTVTWRELARAIREDETLTSAVLPAGSGLLVATKS